MIPQHFVGQTMVIEAPADHDHDRLEVYGLPVKIEKADGILFFDSCWKPSPEQLATLNAGGGVRVRCVGGQPPLDVDTLDASMLLGVHA